MGHKRSISYLKGHFFFSYLHAFTKISIRVSCYDRYLVKMQKVISYYIFVDQKTKKKLTGFFIFCIKSSYFARQDGKNPGTHRKENRAT